MTLIIIIITAIISILALSNNDLFYKLQFNAYQVKHSNQIYRFLTHGFIHVDWMHLAVNMFVLYSFGNVVEVYFEYLFPEKAWFYYILLYIGGILFSSLASYLKHNENPYYNAVGASGAVSSVLFASIFLHPAGKIGFLFLPFDIPAVVFGILYLLYSGYMGKKANDNIGHDAHFWGAIFGVIFTIALRPSLVFDFINKISTLFGG